LQNKNKEARFISSTPSTRLGVNYKSSITITVSTTSTFLQLQLQLHSGLLQRYF